MNITITWQRSITTALASAAVVLAGCSDGGSSSSAGDKPDSVTAACLSVGGEITQLSGETWNCEGIPEPDDEEYARIDALFAPFCPEPMGFSNGFTGTEPPEMGWACWVDTEAEGGAGSGGSDIPAASAMEEACLVVSGTYTVNDDGGWTCGEVPLTEQVTYEYANALFAPFCSLPMILTDGWAGDNPLRHGWTCALQPVASAMSASEACDSLEGTFADLGPDGWTCDNAIVGFEENYQYIDEYLKVFCDEAMAFTSGVSDDGDPLIAGWSCAQP